MQQRGPVPKDPAKRVRRNKETRHTIEAGAQPKPPALQPSYLADGERVPYLAATKRWWRSWRDSPMAARFESTDWERLLMLAPQVDAYHRTSNPRFLAEIRQSEAELGGTVASRLRLRIDIERPGEPQPKSGAARRRAGLHVVA